MLVKKLKI